MRKPSIFCTTAVIALLAIPLSTLAESWSCKNGDDVREIDIQTESSSRSVPCSVVYKKRTEGAKDQVLWTSSNAATYCEEQAKAFVEKQVSWGWSCVKTEDGGIATSKTNIISEIPADQDSALPIPGNIIANCDLAIKGFSFIEAKLQTALFKIIDVRTGDDYNGALKVTLAGRDGNTLLERKIVPVIDEILGPMYEFDFKNFRSLTKTAIDTIYLCRA
jgi:hypothetical protein